MLRKILFISLLFFYNLLFSQCPSGNIVLYNQSDVDNFVTTYPNCEVITGNLSISGDANNFSKLTSIKRIEGNLVMEYSKISDISNFFNLEFVGGDLKIRGTAIKNLVGFNKLKTVNGNLLFYENYQNETINGFQNLETIKGELQFYEHSLQTITGFEKLIEVNSNLRISDNASLSQIPRFSSLKTIGGELSITTNTQSVLQEINGFNALEFIGHDFNLSVYSLVSVQGFKNLKKIQRFLQISSFGTGSPFLKTIPEFESLEIIGSGFTLFDSGLTTLSGFNNLKSTGSIDPSVGWIIIANTTKLESIIGFNNLKTIEGVAQIIGNEKLKNIQGFKNLNKIGAGLDINYNPSLKTLDGLQSLTQLGERYPADAKSLVIVNNSSLTDCSAICNLLSSPLKNGLTEIIGNPSKCSNQNEVQQECIPDFDRDNILDDVDLDDDNDGILDIVEDNGIPNRDTDGDGFPDSRDLDSDNDSCFDVIEAGFEDNDGDGFLGNTPYIVDQKGLVTSAINGYNTPIDSNSDGVFNFQTANILNAGKNGNLHICISTSPVNLFNYLTENPDAGGTWSPSLSSGNGIFNPATDPSGIYTYTISNGNCGSKSAQVTVVKELLPNAGENNKLSICINSQPLDLFTILKNSPDTGGTWSPALSGGVGFFDPKKDPKGIYKYTVTNGSCLSDTAEIIVDVQKLPNAGENNNIVICSNGDLIELFANLKGTPDLGGVWTPILKNPNGIFNPKMDLPGTYTYTVSNEKCGSDSAEIKVTVDSFLTAGENGTLSICTNNEPIDLFNSLKGSPNIGGTWSPTLKSTTGIFDPKTDSSGVYKYTIKNGSCQSNSSEVMVDVFKLPNAGENNNISICVNTNPINLFDSLKGSPDKGGFWTPNLSDGGGLFNPLKDSPGTYIYKINNGNCGIDSAEITISVTTVSNISNYKIKTVDFNDNNSIEIIINSDLQYEYSLDGIIYQKENTFNNLTEGDYTVFVKELNGCGYIEEKISLLNYPKFFTPNGDGHNDVWQLIGSTDKKYSITIFNRYGKFLKELSQDNPAWDGIYSGIPQPSDDYWFQIKFSDGQIQKGHFSLKR